MKEIEKVISTIGEGLKSLAKGIETIAGQIENLVKEDAPPKPRRKAKPAPKPTPKPKPKATAKKKTKRDSTAIETVYGIISRSRKGVGMETLTKKTGFDKKKIANNIYKLKKQGKITSISKGVYKKV